MKKLNERKKGISLIVLVITIIVMIILAAAIILSLQSSGIIDKANQAKIDTDAATLKEVVSMANAEWEMMTEDERKGQTYESFMRSKVGTILGEDTEKWIVMNVKLKDLIDMGYVVSEAEGTVYLTGLNSDIKKSVATVTAKGYTVKDTNSQVVTTGNMTTEYKIYKGSEELATVVYFGEVDGITTSIDTGDALEILSAISGVEEVKPYMDLNHDGLLSAGDTFTILKCISESIKIQEIQNANVNAITKVIKKSVTIPKEEIFEMVAIHTGEITHNETDGFDYLTLKKEYTYKELTDEMKSKYGCTVQYIEDPDELLDVDNQSTEKIKSGIEVYIGAIYYEKIVDDTSYNYNYGLTFKTN